MSNDERDLLRRDDENAMEKSDNVGHDTTTTTTLPDDDENDDDRTSGGGGQLASIQYLQQIVDQFPSTVYSFGYGSGVFSQSLGSSSSPGMLDMILVVNDATEFHKINQQRWHNHYATWLRYMDGGTGVICSNVQRYGLRSLVGYQSLNNDENNNSKNSTTSRYWGQDAHVLFHVVDDDDDDNGDEQRQQSTTGMMMKLPNMKYGVIQYDDMIRDLTQWESLYIAGRMQKPTMSILVHNDDDDAKIPDELVTAQQTNLNAATATALLLSPLSSMQSSSSSLQSSSTTTMSWPVFFQTIASISYSGDFRMQVGGEDPRKLQKLVEGPGQLSRFHNLYQPSINQLVQSGIVSTSTSSSSSTSGANNESLSGSSNTLTGLEWNSKDPSARHFLMQQLPLPVQASLQKRSAGNIMNDNDFAIALSTTLAAIVGPAARNQSFKGIFTLGLRKSIRYASAKLSKGLFRKR